MGWLKMTDMKLTDQVSRHEIDLGKDERHSDRRYRVE